MSPLSWQKAMGGERPGLVLAAGGGAAETTCRRPLPRSSGSPRAALIEVSWRKTINTPSMCSCRRIDALEWMGARRAFRDAGAGGRSFATVQAGRPD
jgi:hypothetical protein